MDKTLRTAATGLAAEQKYVEIIANNISNVNTTGFKKVRPEFQDLLYETLQPAGAVSQVGTEPLNEVQIGSGTRLVATTRILSQGDVTQTNNTLDMAINGEGYFMIRKPDNSIAYTRDGSFHLDAQGQIVNSQGYLLEPGFSIPDDTTDIQVSRDGYLQVALNGETQAQVLGQIELARFINPGGLRAVGDNLFVETPASGQPIYEQPGVNNTGEILQKSLENSNVDIVEEMVNMITAQRAYELNSKSVMTADNILATAVNLKR
ncbi:MAG TPA: flagellar basal-body rod protein FlgG [Candidatus Kapabacteria bacterium]|jgi:flagellar basal-body rod protein FlgG|nr:flagellar basal-body rod protein FlgG [Candidatus Kapabacteria bacterium]HOV91835.1 flagellar basal-body rod protein FlgG [Candidatus Kapabacteria bacterium]